MGFYKNSLGVEILRYLNHAGQVPRKNLYTPFIGYAYRYYARVVKQLIEEGYLSVTRYNRVNCVAITDKGKAQLTNLFSEDEEMSRNIQEEKKTAYTPKQKKRQKLVSDMEGLCQANGFWTSAADKPNLSTLMKGTQRTKDESFFEEAVNNGVYYSMGEIRSAYIEIIGKNEIANWTRLVGVLFFKGHLSFLYSVDKTLIKWMATNEQRSVNFIVNFLKMSPVITKYIHFFDHPTCIVCGEGMTMVPKLVTGRKWGRTDGDKNSERYKAKFATTHINSHNLSKVFCTAYYVPCNKAGVDIFRLASILSEPVRERAADSWFTNVQTAMRLNTLSYHQGVTTNGKHERVVYIPCVDLIELDFLKKQNTPCHIVTPKGTQQAIARTLGPLVLSIRSLEGEKLRYKQYDEYGAPVNLSP